MPLINNRNFLLVLLLIISTHHMTSQIQFGVSYGGNYDFGRETPDGYKSKGIGNINLMYVNESRLRPFLSIGFTKIPLNYSQVLVANQGYFRTVVINNSTSFGLGIESVVKEYLKSQISARFGFGINVFRNPSVWLENSHESFGYNTSYSKNSETKFPFIDLSGKIERFLSEHWSVNCNIGTEYYPRESSLAILTNINQKDIEVNSSFSKIRPYAKIGITYSLKNYY